MGHEISCVADGFDSLRSLNRREGLCSLNQREGPCSLNRREGWGGD